MKLEFTRHDLKILSICYYIHAGTIAFSALFCLAYAAFLSVVFNSIPTGPGKATIPPGMATLIGSFLVGFSVVWIVAAVLTFLCGRYLPRGQHRVFCYVVASLTCLAVPYGTTLGVFTFLVLGRPEARQIGAGVGAMALGPEPPPVPMG